jgi:hypothetical protein
MNIKHNSPEEAVLLNSFETFLQTHRLSMDVLKKFLIKTVKKNANDLSQNIISIAPNADYSLCTEDKNLIAKFIKKLSADQFYLQVIYGLYSTEFSKFLKDEDDSSNDEKTGCVDCNCGSDHRCGDNCNCHSNSTVEAEAEVDPVSHLIFCTEEKTDDLNIYYAHVFIKNNKIMHCIINSA